MKKTRAFCGFLDLGWEGRDVGVRRIVWWNWQLSATRALDEARGLGGDFDVRFREV